MVSFEVLRLNARTSLLANGSNQRVGAGRESVICCEHEQWNLREPGSRSSEREGF